MIVYADNNATAPVKDSHYDAVIEILKRVDGNPSSIHSMGREAKIALEDARAAVAALFGARTGEIVFTSGATEANNIVIQGSVQKSLTDSKKPHLVVSAIEHPAVLEPARLLEERGLCRVTVVPVDRNGIIDPKELIAALSPDTTFVSVMHANNEVGSIQNIEEIAGAVKASNPEIHFHTDAVQMIGKTNISYYGTTGNIDSAAVSCHKLGGFKGTGALFLRSGTKLAPFLAGGGQERSRRPGTENLPGIVSFSLIAKEILGHEDAFADATRPLRDAWIEILSSIPGAHVHGDPATCLANTVNFHIDGIPGEDILLNFDLAGIRASSGSACSSGVGRPSHVLTALGYSDTAALNSIRTSFHPSVTHEAILHMEKILKELIKRIRISTSH